MTNESQQQPSCTLSTPKEASPRFERILALGRRLVEELGKDTSNDTLSRWMSHYVAELMETAENSLPHERAVAEKKCFDAILDLWSHHAELPDGKRPFETLEPIMRAVESLDPDDESPRYFRKIRGGIVEEDEDVETRSILEFVGDLDSTARTIIGYALVDAARAAKDSSKEWVALVEDAGMELGGAHRVVLRIISGRADAEGIQEQDPEAYECELLQERITRLEAFTKVAALVCADLKSRLEALPSKGK